MNWRLVKQSMLIGATVLSLSLALGGCAATPATSTAPEPLACNDSLTSWALSSSAVPAGLRTTDLFTLDSLVTGAKVAPNCQFSTESNGSMQSMVEIFLCRDEAGCTEKLSRLTVSLAELPGYSLATETPDGSSTFTFDDGQNSGAASVIRQPASWVADMGYPEGTNIVMTWRQVITSSSN